MKALLFVVTTLIGVIFADEDLDLCQDKFTPIDVTPSNQSITVDWYPNYNIRCYETFVDPKYTLFGSTPSIRYSFPSFTVQVNVYMHFYGGFYMLQTWKALNKSLNVDTASNKLRFVIGKFQPDTPLYTFQIALKINPCDLTQKTYIKEKDTITILSYPVNTNNFVCPILIQPASEVYALNLKASNLSEGNALYLFRRNATEPDYILRGDFLGPVQIPSNEVRVEWVNNKSSNIIPWTLSYEPSKEYCSVIPLLLDAANHTFKNPIAKKSDSCNYIISPPGAWTISVTLTLGTDGFVLFRPGGSFLTRHPKLAPGTYNFQYASPLGISHEFNPSANFSISYTSSNQRPTCYRNYTNFFGIIKPFPNDTDDCYYYITHNRPFAVHLNLTNPNSSKGFLQMFSSLTPNSNGSIHYPNKPASYFFQSSQSALLKSTKENSTSPNNFTLEVAPVEEPQPEEIDVGLIIGVTVGCVVAAAIIIALLVIFIGGGGDEVDDLRQTLV